MHNFIIQATDEGGVDDMNRQQTNLINENPTFYDFYQEVMLFTEIHFVYISIYLPLGYLCRKEFLLVLYPQSRHSAFFCEELDSDSCSAPAQTVSRTPPTQSEVR